MGKGSRPHPPFPLPSSAVTHVVMEQTSAEEAICWQESRAARAPGCARAALLDISWFTESMAAGQPVPVEDQHRLEVSWAEEEHRATEEGLVQGRLRWDRWQAAVSRGGGQRGLCPDGQTRPPTSCSHCCCRLPWVHLFLVSLGLSSSPST